MRETIHPRLIGRAASRTRDLTATTVGLLGVALIAACGGGDREEADPLPDFAAWDSAGIMVAENALEVARAPAEFCVDSVPDLQIGVVEGEPAYQFHGLGNMRSLPDGRIVAVNVGTKELRYFDQDGRFLKAIGGLGSGPGEFLQMVLTPQSASDTLVLWDPHPGSRRLTWITIEGELIGTARSSGGPGVITEGIGMTVSFVAPTGLTPPIDPDRWRFIRLSEMEELTSFEVPHTYWPTGAPLTAAPAFAVTHGEFYLYTSLLSGIRSYAPTGELRRIVRLREQPRVRGERFEKLARDWVDRSPTRLERESRSAQVEELRSLPLPAFQALHVDQRGWLWAHRFELSEADALNGAEGPRLWMVFDRDGRARGSLQMPPGLYVRHVSVDHVLGSWRDEFGISYIRRHRVRDRPCS